MFDLLFDFPTYRKVYVISDREFNELQNIQIEGELDEIIEQKKKLNNAYKEQIKHLEEREKELKNKVKLNKNS